MPPGEPARVASPWPIELADVRAARERLAPHLAPTPLREYGTLNEAVGHGIRVLVKHENHQPTGAFKARNNLAAVILLGDAELARGVVTASRGNHGAGLAWAAAMRGAVTTVFVPVGNSPGKNAAMRALGATLVEVGTNYDAALAAALAFAAERGATFVHPTNDRNVVAGAATLTLEILEQAPDVEALVIAVGGGSQAVGAMTVTRAAAPDVPVFGAQAAAAPAIHDSWHAGAPRPRPAAPTLADGLATSDVYELTFPALRAGLAGFVTVQEEEIAAAIRLLLDTTHNLAEGAGATGLAGLLALADRLAGRRVAIILSGGNIDRAVLRQVLDAGTNN